MLQSEHDPSVYFVNNKDNTESPQDDSEVQHCLTSSVPSQCVILDPCSLVSLPGLANQCVATTLNENVKRVSPGLSPDNTLCQGDSSCKSNCDDSSTIANLVVAPNYDLINYDVVVQNEVTLIKSRCKVRGSTVSIQDMVSDNPTFLEASDLLKIRSRTTSNRLVSIYTIFNDNKSMNEEFICLWQVVLDLYRVAVLYGFMIPLSTYRSDMLRTWLYYIIHTIQFDPVKTVSISDLECNFIYSRWMKVVKYKLGAFASWAKGSPVLPENPLKLSDNCWFIISKKFYNFISSNREISSGNRGRWYMSLVDSICRGVKKGAPRSTKSDCIINELETFKLFTDPNKTHVTTFNHKDYPTLNEDDITVEIKRSVVEILGDQSFYPTFSHCPSFSSCTENKLTKGGHVLIVKQHIPHLPIENVITTSVQYGTARDPMPERYFNPTDQEDPIVNKAFDTIKESDGFRNVKYIEFDLQQELGSDIDIEHFSEICLMDPSVIVPIGLSEALKVRGITTPCALETWLLKPLQQYLFNSLKKHNVFAVTATPLTPEHLSAVIKGLRPEQKFLSGDYDNATNNMYSKSTRDCIEAICEHLQLSENYRKVVVRSLVGNIVQYSLNYNDYDKLSKQFVKEKTKVSFKEEQTEAQPMGKILSFSVLCMINFAVCRKAVEIDYGISVPISHFPGLINGDDCCFPLTDFDIWVKVAAMVGLYNSIGKTFFSREFIEMNSRTFMVKEHTYPLIQSDPLYENLDIISEFIDEYAHPKETLLNIEFCEIPFLNFGLLKGLVRSGNAEDKQNLNTKKREIIEAVSRMGWCHSQLVRDFEFMYQDLDFLFKTYHNKFLLSPMLNGVPYYIPFWLGGLGLNPGPRPDKQINTQHRQCASYILQRYKALGVKNICLEKTCLINSLYEREIKKITKKYDISEEDQNLDYTTITNFDDTESYDLVEDNRTIYNKYVESIWRNNDINQFFVEMDDANFLRQSDRIGAKKLMHNCDIWKRAYSIVNKTGSKVSPLPWYKIWHQKNEDLKPLVVIRNKNERFINSLVANSL
jgi:hypothetical protein